MLFNLKFSVVLIILTLIYLQGCNVILYILFIFLLVRIFHLHMTIFLNYNAIYVYVYFLAIILNIGFLIVFAILTYLNA